jgi:SAM-dependent methyltransferase
VQHRDLTASHRDPLARQTAEAGWDRWSEDAGPRLPPAGPPTRALLGQLPCLPDHASIVDLACGLGVPTFEVARQHPDAGVLGVDSAARLIDTARATARAWSVPNVRFEVMSLNDLALPDASADAVVSQFGFLQEGDVAASAREMARILKDGGVFSVAAFDSMKLNTLFGGAAEALARHVPRDLLPDFDYLTGLAAPGLRERLLREAGISALHTEMFTWAIPVLSFDAVWSLLSGPVPFGQAWASLDVGGLVRVRDDLEAVFAPFSVGEAYEFPMACRLFWGRK